MTVGGICVPVAASGAAKAANRQPIQAAVLFTDPGWPVVCVMRVSSPVASPQQSGRLIEKTQPDSPLSVALYVDTAGSSRPAAEFGINRDRAMKNVHALVASIAGASAVVFIAAPALAHPVLRSDEVYGPGPEASGCYFSRGEMFCGRYCYIEINGKRYCQPRERDAYPQGHVYIEESLVGQGSYRRHHRHHGLKPSSTRLK